MEETVSKERIRDSLISGSESEAQRPDNPKSLAMQIEIEGPVLFCVYFFTCFFSPPPRAILKCLLIISIFNELILLAGRRYTCATV